MENVLNHVGAIMTVKKDLSVISTTIVTEVEFVKFSRTFASLSMTQFADVTEILILITVLPMP
jgi:hypothetical protein